MITHARRNLLLGLSFAALGAAPCAAQQPKPTTLQPGASTLARVVTLGTHARLALPKEAKRLAIGDERILSIELINTKEALVLGKQTGTTTVLAWYTDGTHEPLLFRVQQDLSLLQSALDDIVVGVRAQMAPDRDAIVLSGLVPDEIHRQAILRAATSYLSAIPRQDLVISARDEADRPDKEDAARVQLRGGSDSQVIAPQVIDLLRVTKAPTSLETRILEAIRPIAGEDVRVRRLQRNPISNDEADVLVLEGSVPNQIALVRAMQLAARLYLGGENQGTDTGRNNAIRVIADEAGALIQGQNNQSGGNRQGGGGGQGQGQGNSTGGQGGFAGGGGVGVQQNQVRRNLGRATVLSMAKGRVLSFLKVVDRPQVRVDVQLFEIDRDRLFRFSSEVQTQVSDFDQPPLNPSAIGSRTQPNPASVGAFANTDVQAGLASLANGLSQQVQVSGGRFALDFLIQALEARGIARRLSSPVLTVLNGETAQFQVGGEIPVPQAFTPAAGSGSGLGTFASVEFRSFGVGIGVRPLVGEAGEVTLDISSIVSQPDENLTTLVRDSTGTQPQTTAFATRSLRTNANLQDGQSLLVGGLISRSQRDDVTKTPILGDLPLIGWLFRSNNKAYSESELFVLVSPSVVRPPIPNSGLWLQPAIGETLAACRNRIPGSTTTKE